MERCIKEGLLPPTLCRELRLLHLAAAVPGYRPNCTACTLLACPVWGWPALLRARELARNAAEDFFDEFGGLWPETTVTVCWFPGSSLPMHTDNCKDYLSKRHVSVVVWLSSQGEDFEGGEFFFQGAGQSEAEEVVRPRAGNAALFRADEPHGLRGVVRGARLALNVWFTRDPGAAEDAKLLQLHMLRASTRSERLFGLGPQACWPSDEAAACLAKRTLAQVGLPPRAQVLKPRRHRLAATNLKLRSGLPAARRARLAVAAHSQLLAAENSRCAGRASRCFFRLLRRRERQVCTALPQWHQHGLVSLAQLSSPCSACCRKVRDGTTRGARVEVVEEVPGLVIARGVLGGQLQRRLRKLADSLMSAQGKLMNQAMRFGTDVPPWAHALARRTRVPALSTP